MTKGNEGYTALIANFKTNLIKFLPFLQKMKGWKMKSMIKKILLHACLWDLQLSQ